MERILIKHVEIKHFRNLKNASFDAYENYTMIRGNNMKGKTNVLNALMWCICGVDLQGSNDDFANIPFELRHDGEGLVDVTVELNVCTIRRVVDYKDNKASQRLFIDGDESAIKAGDILIDSKLGILELSLKDTSSFKIRRFLLNPMYYLQCSPSDFRKWVIRFACGDVDEKATLSKCDLPDKVKNIISAGITTFGDVAKFSKSVADVIKKSKEELGHLDYAKNVLNVDVDSQIKNVKAIKFANEEDQVAIKEFATYLNDVYSKLASNSCIRITLLEEGRDGTFNDVCYPTMINGSSVKLGSTAEKIFAACEMVYSVCKFANINSLPMFLDEGETIDSVILAVLNRNIISQKFISYVKFELDEGLSIDGK